MRRGLLILTCALLVGACSAPIRNARLADDAELGLNAKTGYRFQVVRSREVGHTLVIASFSGGGTRAAALADGALRAFAATRWSPSNESLADKIDIVSSVSGGSVTAAQFALFGTAGLDRLEHDFIRRNIVASIIGNALRPDHLFLLPTARRSRIDSLIDVLRDKLFSDPNGKALTYGNLLDRSWVQRQQPAGAPIRHPPYLILNAADMGSGTVFPFTQQWFDLLCSDLTQLPIAMAVASSAAFPVAFSPVLLKNYTTAGCPAQDAARRRGEWPPQSWTNALETSPYTNPERNRRAHVQAQYLETGHGAKKFVHLLDGGTADNVGLSEPLHFLSAATAEGSLRQAILDLKIDRIVWLIVNARSEKSAALDASDATPGIVSQLTAVTNAGVDNSTFGRLYRLRSTLEDVLTRDMQNQIDHARLAGNGDATWVKRLEERRLAILRGLKIYAIPVDFDFVDSPSCRTTLKEIRTSWALPDHDVDLLLAVGAAMVYRAPDYARLFAEGVIQAPDDVTKLLTPIRGVDDPRKRSELALSLGKPLVEAACRKAR